MPVAGDTVVATAASGTVGAVVANSARAGRGFDRALVRLVR